MWPVTESRSSGSCLFIDKSPSTLLSRLTAATLLPLMLAIIYRHAHRTPDVWPGRGSGQTSERIGVKGKQNAEQGCLCAEQRKEMGAE